MKSLSCTFIFCILLYSTVHSQTRISLVNIIYDKEKNITTVASELMNLINTNSEFLEIQLSASYPKKGLPEKPPCDIIIGVSSYNKGLLYQTSNKIVIIADDKSIDIGSKTYLVTDVHIRDNLLVHTTNKTKMDGTQLTAFNRHRPIPPEAAILKDNKDKMLNEYIGSKEIPLQLLVELAKAEKLDFQIGQTKFSFNETQVKTLREFANNVTPKDGILTEKLNEKVEGLISTAPAEAKNTPIDQTLKWLKNVFSYKAERNWDAGYPIGFDALGFSDCRIGFKEYPMVVSVPKSDSRYIPPTSEVYINLADLDPETISLSNDDCYKPTIIRFLTLNRQKKIKRVLRNNTGNLSTSSDRLETGGFFYIGEPKLVPSFYYAFVHAIKRCQAKQ